MGKRGAPLGNKNASRTRPFWHALDRVLAQERGKQGDRLRLAAEKLLDLAAAGEAWAVRELADRLDGRVPQALEHTGPEGRELPGTINVVLTSTPLPKAED